MASITTRYDLPFPEDDDTPAGSTQMEALAEAVEDAIASVDDRNSTIVSAGNAANSATFSNITPSVLTPTVGTAFVAPPSGNVLVVGGVYVRNRNATYTTYGGIRVKTGSTLDAGTVVYDPSIEPNGKVTVGFVVSQLESSVVFTLTGLTPGASYNACAVGWVDNAAGTGDIYSRRISIVNL
jgi:hypothetical protein